MIDCRSREPDWAGRVAQWQGVCLACTRPWVQPRHQREREKDLTFSCILLPESPSASPGGQSQLFSYFLGKGGSTENKLWAIKWEIQCPSDVALLQNNKD